MFLVGLSGIRKTATDRIRAVAKGELGATIEFDPVPTLVLESIFPEWRDRAHFISLLYLCRLTSDLDESHRYSPESPLPDQWLWHERYPENLIKEQRAYAVYLGYRGLNSDPDIAKSI